MDQAVRNRDRVAEAHGWKPFYLKRHKIGKDYRGGVCETELRAIRLIPNTEGRHLRLEKRLIRNGKIMAAQVMHLSRSEFEAILKGMSHGPKT